MVSFILSRLEGWKLAGTLTLLLVLVTAAVAASGGFDIDSLRQVIRLTARTSLLLFLLPFTASAAFALLPGPFTRWQRRNRRYLGVSFAVSHLIHAVAIFALFRMDAPLFWTLSNVGAIMIGGLAYVFIFAMALTSFDGAQKWLGPGFWKALHVTGNWYIWVLFVYTFGKRIPISGWYAAPVLLLFVAVLMRIFAYVSRRGLKTTAATN
jgi:methionine sulfoxide reductase heme-binding subunit